MAVQTNWGPPDLSASINQGVEAITGGIQDYRLGQELQNMPRTADGSPDFQAMALRLMRSNPAAAQRMMAMEEMKQRRSYQDRYLTNQERQTDIAADRTQNLVFEDKVIHIGRDGKVTGVTDANTGQPITPGQTAPATQQQQQPRPSPVNAGVGKQPTPDHLQKLQADPNLAPMFDEVYGPGSAQRYLHGGGPAATAQQLAQAPGTVQQPPAAPMSAGVATDAASQEADAALKHRLASMPYSARKKYWETRGAQLGGINEAEVTTLVKGAESGRNTLGSLAKMVELNKTAFQLPGAGIRGTIASATGIGGKKAGTDTLELQNMITSGALEQLRATFGGNPTEGERKILLDVQGSINMPADARERIFQNAIETTRKRIQYNQALAEDMRRGTFLVPREYEGVPQTSITVTK